jgi:hypothetical protein
MGAYLACYYYFVGGIVLFVPIVGKIRWYATSKVLVIIINLSKKGVSKVWKRLF